MPRNTSPQAALDPQVAAQRAKLHHVSDEMPGISRREARNGFDFLWPDGSLIGDTETLQRIHALAVPPAWTDVWICPDPNGHLQAVGRDRRGRKQYRYHPRWRQVRDEAKFHKLLTFARVLPQLRAGVEADLRRIGLSRERVLAAVVRLMELTLFRVGNGEYAKTNGSFGLTTLRDRHVAIEGSHIHLSFRGKGGKHYDSDINDRRLARIIKHCRELPGYELFQYVDEGGTRHAIGSADVNDYLRELTGEDITAKDFRTWAATHLAAGELQKCGEAGSGKQSNRALLTAIEEVAGHLGNTAVICRRCYIHPAICEGYLDGSLLQALSKVAPKITGLDATEAAVAKFLSRRLGEEIDWAPEASKKQPAPQRAPVFFSSRRG